MTAAIYQKANLATNAYNETLSYDKNGNIMHLNRTGHYDTSIGMAFSIDDLSYNYKPSSNILDFVSDQTNSTVGFRDGPIPGTDYNYDLNTNLIADNNKKIEKISYNHLNLPTKIKFSLAGQNEINYLYNALGVKRIKTVESTNAFGIPLTNQTNYVDGFQYLNNELQFFPTAEGYVSVSNGDNYNYVYNYTDHLGNIRISYSKEGTELKILEENHYYPFGLKHSYNIDTREYSVKEANSIATIIFVDRSNYQYKYNGKELQDELGLNFYDYGARNYDPAIGRWMNIDPLAETMPSWSPYSFCFNNPLRFTDPTGMAPDDFVQRKDGSIYWDNNANSQATTKSGETYLGKTLTFNFNSYIDAKLWDGPMGDTPAGDKLTSTIKITGNENSKGELTGMSATQSVKVGETPVGEARDYYPGEGGSNNTSSLNRTSTGYNLNFEQHASVSKFEEFGMNVMGFKIVDVAQKLNINYNSGNGNLSVSTYTGVFPSATLSVNGSQIMKYNQPSFTGTHSAPPLMSPYFPKHSEGLDFSYYPSKFYKR